MTPALPGRKAQRATQARRDLRAIRATRAIKEIQVRLAHKVQKVIRVRLAHKVFKASKDLKVKRATRATHLPIPTSRLSSLLRLKVKKAQLEQLDHKD